MTVLQKQATAKNGLSISVGGTTDTYYKSFSIKPRANVDASSTSYVNAGTNTGLVKTDDQQSYGTSWGGHNNGYTLSWDMNHAHGLNITTASVSSSDTESRPFNSTYRIWKRTA